MPALRALAALAETEVLVALGAGRGVVLDGLLGAEVVAAARTHVLDLDARDELRPAGIGHGAIAVPAVRGDRIAWIDPEEVPEPLRPVVLLLDAARVTLNETAWLGADELECQVALYDIGSGYERHRDALQGTSTRRVTAIYYLNEWRPGDGGELELYGEEPHATRIVEPIGDRLVLFRSDLTDHAVRPVMRGHRIAISAFFRRRRVL